MADNNFKADIVISNEDVRKLLILALSENGQSRYWADYSVEEFSKILEERGEDVESPEFAIDHDDWTIEIKFKEEYVRKGGWKSCKLGKSNLKLGIYGLSRYKRSFRDFINGDIEESDVSDIFMQSCIYGQHMYIKKK